MNINLKKLNEKAKVPQYSREGDAGLDLHSTSSFEESEDLICYRTGIAVEIPQGFVGLIFPRSSLSKYDLILANHVGVIDSNYRGEIIVKFKKTKILSHIFLVGDRVAQLIIMPYPSVTFNVVEELSETNRGDNGFGSSGT